MKGFFLTLLLIIAIWMIQLLLNIRTSPANNTASDNNPQQNMKSNVSVNAEGEALFQNNCSSCHNPFKVLTGPALAGVEERVPDKKLLYAWIRNNRQVLESGNKYFNSLYLEYNKTAMSQFPQLTDKNIDAILEYLKQVRHPLPQPAVASVFE